MGLWIMLLLCAGLLSACGQAEPAAPAASAPELSAAADVQPAAPPVDRGLARETRLAIGEETYTIRRIGTDEGDPWDPTVDTVEIYRGEDLNGPVQVFPDFRGDGTPPLDGELRVEDLNFDGWPDFRLFNCRHRGNECWYCWLWDPEADAFTYAADFSQLSNCVWNQEEQVVYTADSCGLAGARYSVYSWEGSQLVCLRQFELSVDMYEPPHTVENRFYVRQDGELRLEREWHGAAGEWGESLVAPEAAPFLALTQPEETPASSDEYEITNTKGENGS